MAKPAKAKTFERETDLCAAFVAALPDSWTAYAETGGWDLLLVRRQDGFQIGIQAKLRLNVDVLLQAIEGRYSATNPGPDCRAVLVPWGTAQGMAAFGPYLGITVIRMPFGGAELERRSRWERFEPTLPQSGADWASREWYELAPTSRHALPEYVPDVVAGAASPVQLTDWKIGALRIMVLLDRRGYVTREDFKVAGIDHRRWISPRTGWLVARDGRWYAGDALPDFRGQHPVVFERVKADMSKWAPVEVGNLL